MVTANPNIARNFTLTIVDHMLALLDLAVTLSCQFGDFIANALQTRVSETFVREWIAAH